MLKATRVGRSFAKERHREIETGALLEAFETGQARLEDALLQGSEKNRQLHGYREGKQSRETQLQPCCFSNRNA